MPPIMPGAEAQRQAPSGQFNPSVTGYNAPADSSRFAKFQAATSAPPTSFSQEARWNDMQRFPSGQLHERKAEVPPSHPQLAPLSNSVKQGEYPPPSPAYAPPSHAVPAPIAKPKESASGESNVANEPKSPLPVSRLDPAQVPNPHKDLSLSGPYPYPRGGTFHRPTDEIEYQRFCPHSVLEPSVRRVPEYSSFIEHSKIPWVVCINMMSSFDGPIATDSQAKNIPVIVNSEVSTVQYTNSPVDEGTARNAGPPRCERCRSYFCVYSGINENGSWKCNFCGMKRNRLPIHLENMYRGLRYSNTPADGESNFDRSFFCSQTVEYLVDGIEMYAKASDQLADTGNSLAKLNIRERNARAPSQNSIPQRDPMHFLFCVELPPAADPVARNSLEWTIQALSTTLDQMRDGKADILVSFITYARDVHFYDFHAANAPHAVGDTPRQICMGDTHSPFVPLPFTTRCWLSLQKDFGHIQRFLSVLSEYSPRVSTYGLDGSSVTPRAALGAAVRCSQLILNHSGGHVVVCATNGCSHGIGQITPREENTLMGKCDDKGVLNAGANASAWWTETATEAAKRGISFDMLFLNDKTNFLEMNTLTQLAHFSSGRVLNVHRLIPSIGTAFSANAIDPLARQLDALLCRPMGHAGVLRVRVSKGTRLKKYSGHFFSNQKSQEIDVPLVSPSHSYIAEIEHEGSAIEAEVDSTPECASLIEADAEEVQQHTRGFWYFQAALLYTSTDGSRRLRIASLRLPITNQYATLFRSVNLECTFAGFAHHGINELAESGVHRAKDALTDRLAQLLFCYRRQCSSSQHTGQLILPESLKLLPLYIYALLRTKAFRRAGSNTRMDDRSIDLHWLRALPPTERVSYVYPYMVNLREYDADPTHQDVGCFYMPPPAQLCGACFQQADAHVMHDSASQAQFVYIPRGEASPGSIKAEAVMGKLSTGQQILMQAIRLRSPSIACVPVCAVQGSGDINETGLMDRFVEDQVGDAGPSYIDFLCQLHGAIRELLLIS